MIIKYNYVTSHNYIKWLKINIHTRIYEGFNIIPDS